MAVVQIGKEADGKLAVPSSEYIADAIRCASALNKSRQPVSNPYLLSQPLLFLNLVLFPFLLPSINHPSSISIIHHRHPTYSGC
jgi:hypothetical protein